MKGNHLWIVEVGGCDHDTLQFLTKYRSLREATAKAEGFIKKNIGPAYRIKKIEYAGTIDA
jgi:hypothetical protein